MDKTYLAHFGVKDMHWGIRRYQNPDGSYTDLGRQHYGIKSSRASNYGSSSSVVSTQKKSNPSTKQQEKFNNELEQNKAFFKQYAKTKITDIIKYPSKEQKIARGVAAVGAAKSVVDSAKNLREANEFLADFGRKVAPHVAIGKTVGAAALTAAVGGAATYGVAKGVSAIKDKASKSKKASNYGSAEVVDANYREVSSRPIREPGPGDAKVITEASSKFTKGMSKMFPKTDREDLSAYSDSELQKIVNRQQLEQRYDQLNPNVVEKGAARIDNIIQTAGAGATIYLAYRAIKRG